MQHLALAVRLNPSGAAFAPVSDRHRLLLVNNGRYRLQAQQVHELSPGSLALLPAGQSFALTESEPGDARLLYFCGNCLALEQGHNLLAPFRLARFSAHKVVTSHDEQWPWLNTLLDKMEHWQNESFSAQYDVLRSLLLLVLQEVSLLYPIEKARPRSRNIETALQYIEENYARPVSLAEVAEQAHWSEPYLANKMKSETGRSVGEWLQTFRMAEACALLLQRDDYVADIAHAVGYRDVNHFIRHFSRHIGMTPAAWRKTQQQSAGLTFEHSLNARRK